MAPSETAFCLEREREREKVGVSLCGKREGEEEEGIHVVIEPQNVKSEGFE